MRLLGLLACLLWLIPSPAARAGAPERTFHNCGEVIAVAEPLMPADTFAQLLALTEERCMDVFGDFTPVELHRLLSDPTLHVGLEDGHLIQTRNPGPDATVADRNPPWQRGFLQVRVFLARVKDSVQMFLVNMYRNLTPE